MSNIGAGKEVAGRNIQPANPRNSKADWGAHPATGQSVPVYGIVYISGMNSAGTPAVSLADKAAQASAFGHLYIATQAAAPDPQRTNERTARFSPSLIVGPVDTSAFTAGARVYLGTSGGITPTATATSTEVIRVVGRCIVSDATNGYWEFNGASIGQADIVP